MSKNKEAIELLERCCSEECGYPNRRPYEDCDNTSCLVKEALALLAEQPKAGEFTKGLRRNMREFPDFPEHLRDLFEKDIYKVCDIVDRFEVEARTTVGTNVRLKAEYNKLVVQLATKDADIANLQEQLIKMCRVFHSIDCVCKWCNIAKERAVAGT